MIVPALKETMFGPDVICVTESETNVVDGPEMNGTGSTKESNNGDVKHRPTHLYVKKQGSYELAMTNEDQTDACADDQTSSCTSNSGEPKNKQVVMLVQPQKMSELSFPEGKAFQERYRGYWAYVIAIVLFYAIPTYQLVLTYQRVRRDADICI